MVAPRLSVIVPMYNVERYLEECLQSVADQTLQELECIMVDDGATDGTADIARAFAARDPRFTLVQQENAGLGAARNAGVRHIHPESRYLVFLDSDDIIPASAYQLMVDTLDETGSDFASGNVFLLDSSGTRQSPMHRQATTRTRLKTHISRDKILVYDRLAPNKVFRRTFWEKFEMAFPEGVLYEDIPLTLPAHFNAGTVDVLEDVVYYWRQREAGEGKSITQRRTEHNAVRDRIAAVDGVSRFLAAHAAKDPRWNEYKRWYDESALSGDIRIFIQVLPEGDETFREIFIDRAADFLSRVDPATVAKLPSIMRLKWHLIGARRLPELMEVLAWEKKNGGKGIPVVSGALRPTADYPFRGDPAVGVPNHVYRLDSELKVVSRTTDTAWEGDRLRVTGHAYISELDAASKRSQLRMALLRNRRTKQTAVVPLRTTYTPVVTSLYGRENHNYDWSGFELSIDPRRLRSKGKWVDGTWRLAIGIAAAKGAFRYGRVAIGRGGNAAHPRYRYVEENVRITPQFHQGGLELRVETVRARLTSHQFDGRELLLEGRVYLDSAPAADAAGELVLQRRGGEAPIRRSVELTRGAGGLGFSTSVPTELLVKNRAAELPPSAKVGSSNDTWEVSLVLPGLSRPVRIAMDDDVAAATHPIEEHFGVERELLVDRNGPGHLRLQDRPVQPVADSLGWTADDAVVVAGSWPARRSADAELVLRARGHHEERAFPLTIADGRFEARLTPAALATPAGVVPLRAGYWDFRLRHRDTASGILVDVPVRVAASLFAAEPTRVIRKRAYELSRRHLDQLFLFIDSELDPLERGPYRLKQLRETYYQQERRQPLRQAVLYDAYTGKQFSDSPRAVLEELQRRGEPLEHLWIVRDQQVALPEGVTPVPMWSREWFSALARAKYVITNAHLPNWIRRREGQVIVQAWHGTPLKKIGWDIENVTFDQTGYLERVAEEAQSWSFLVSPNRFSTPILKRAMAFEGEILEAGYPRNDVLYAADREQRAAAVRAELGVPEGRKVILYAPTWRDDKFYSPGRFKLDLQIDLEDARARLGDEYVLLVRKHPNIVDSVPGAGDGFVFDASGFPDINELFLATDVLVTDYSSLMFDFANLGRPMLFFTYDLEHYRDKLRGFYFDFEHEAPGPLISTSTELVDALRDIDTVSARYTAEYEAFRKQFCDLDDGHAASRVIERMFQLGS